MLTAANVKIRAIWDVKPYSLVEDTVVSEVRIVVIFRL
jgi:hypothetical protein